MKKWIVRGFGVIFLLMACSNIFVLLTNPQAKIGLLGLYVHLANIDVTGWIAAGMYLYTGYSLIRLKESGRRWALFFLWVSLIGCIVLLIFGIYTAIYSSPNTSIMLYRSFSGETHSTDNPWIVLPVIGFLDAIFALAIFFLSSKDTKALFHKNSDELEKADAPNID